MKPQRVERPVKIAPGGKVVGNQCVESNALWRDVEIADCTRQWIRVTASLDNGMQLVTHADVRPLARTLHSSAMPEERRTRQFWMEVAIIFAAWTAFALLTLYQTSMQAGLRPGATLPVRWVLLASNLLDSYLWAFATLAAFALVRRFPVERGQIVRAFAIHLVAGAVIVLFRFGAFIGIGRYFDWLPGTSFELLFWSRFNQNVVFYVLLVGVAHATLYYRRYRERERAAEQLAAGLAVARLQALKMQLQPHFLFNTLHAISALIPPDAQPARRMVARLGDLLRISLDHEETQEVTLRDEIAFLQPYLEIEQARLGDRLTVVMAIDSDALDARVPHLILQPLVENAVRHGIAPRIEPGTVRLSATLIDSRSFVELEVRDDGPGIETYTPENARKGVGLRNIRSRLEQLYGDAHRFDFATHSEGGAVVRIRIPLRDSTSQPVTTRAQDD